MKYVLIYHNYLGLYLLKSSSLDDAYVSLEEERERKVG